MTKWLVRLFVKNHEKPQLPEVRASYGKLSGMVGIVCNILLFAVKFLWHKKLFLHSVILKLSTQQ